MKPSSPIGLVDPKRSAHASIHGFLYQACLGVERWLSLGDGEVLLCEGDEDLDRLLREQGLGVVEQVKVRAAPVGDRVLLESLQRFVITYVALRQRGEDRRFVFTTTAERARSGRILNGVDPMSYWAEGRGKYSAEEQETIRSVVGRWLAPDAESATGESGAFRRSLTGALGWLDSEAGRWRDFLDRVEWRFGAPDLKGVRIAIKERLQKRSDAGTLPLSDVLVDWLVSRVLDASRHPEPQDRVLTRELLDGLLARVAGELADWAQRRLAVLLRDAFTELVSLESLLTPGNLSLPSVHSDHARRDGRSTVPPGKLLTAGYEVIPFEEKARARELSELEAWCNDDPPRSVWLWTGQGGSGKTRLALEFCRRMAASGWKAGFLRSKVEADQLAVLVQGVLPRLVIVDYAETRLELVKALLEQAGMALGQGPKLRLLLLARQAGDWWEGLPTTGEATENLLLASPKSRELSPLAEDPGAQFAVYQRAIDTFAQEMEQPLPERLQIQAPVQFDQALYLHMAALNVVLGESSEAGDLLARILAQERRFWVHEINDLLDRTGSVPADLPELLERALAAITLVGGAKNQEEAICLLEAALGPLDRTERSVLMECLRRLYGGGRDGQGRYLEPLQPDLLGEELANRVLLQDISLLAPLLRAASVSGKQQVLTILTRLAKAGRPGAEAWLESALRSDLPGLAEIGLEVALETGNPIGRVLTGLIAGLDNPALNERLGDWCDAKATWNPLSLRDLALLVTQRRVAALPKAPSSEEDSHSKLAGLLSNLGGRLSAAGRLTEALKRSDESVGLYRNLAQSCQTRDFRPELARSLRNLGLRLMELGRRKDALAAARESVDLYRDLSRASPEPFIPKLAACLNNLSVCLGELSHLEEALLASEESVELWEQLMQSGSGAFLPGQAASLDRLGICLVQLGRPEHQRDALSASKRAVEIYQRLAGAWPDTFLPDLASSLTNLSFISSQLNDLATSLSASQESEEIYRRLEESRPDAFRSDWARSLNNLADRLNVSKRSEEALKLSERAVALGSTLAEALPDAFLPSLATSLATKGEILSVLERHDEASAAAEEAVRVLAPLFRQQPKAFAHMMKDLLGDVFRYSQSAGREADQELLAPIIEQLHAIEEERSEPGR
jgi:tetratricopeptide (TPR) repeat protein